MNREAVLGHSFVRALLFSFLCFDLIPFTCHTRCAQLEHNNRILSPKIGWTYVKDIHHFFFWDTRIHRRSQWWDCIITGLKGIALLISFLQVYTLQLIADQLPPSGHPRAIIPNTISNIASKSFDSASHPFSKFLGLPFNPCLLSSKPIFPSPSPWYLSHQISSRSSVNSPICFTVSFPVKQGRR